MIAISAALMTWMIRCFSNLSASRPAVAEKRKKGRMKMPVATRHHQLAVDARRLGQAEGDQDDEARS